MISNCGITDAECIMLIQFGKEYIKRSRARVCTSYGCVSVRVRGSEGCICMCNFGRITIRERRILKRKLYNSQEKYARSRMSKLFLSINETNRASIRMRDHADIHATIF